MASGLVQVGGTLSRLRVFRKTVFCTGYLLWQQSVKAYLRSKTPKKIAEISLATTTKSEP